MQNKKKNEREKSTLKSIVCNSIKSPFGGNEASGQDILSHQDTQYIES